MAAAPESFLLKFLCSSSEQKVYRAREALEEEYKAEGLWEPEEGAAGQPGEKKAVGTGENSKGASSGQETKK